MGWTWTGSQNAAALIVGIKAVRAGGPLTGNPTIDLGRQYEPILHLHPEESFVPVNAKRYVEAAALWAAKVPFDDKNSWGTTPLVKAGQLSAAQNETGDYLGKPDHIVPTPPTNGSWRWAVEEPRRSLGAGRHRRGARTLRRPDREPAPLRHRSGRQKFWYHVELFDTARLKRLAGKASADSI